MLDIESLAVNLETAENGRWFDYPGGGRFLIARFNNSRAEGMRTALTLEHWDKLQNLNEETGKLYEEIDARVMSETVLLGWEDVGSKGKPIKYTPEVGFKYLSDPRMRDLYMFVRNQSINRGNYAEKAEAEAVEEVKDTAAS